METVAVDFNAESYGKIRPLHGVNQGPKTKVFTYDASNLFSRAGIPFSRLHDTEYPYGSGEFVDIPCVFKDFDADENDPESYNFGLTDEYIRAIVDAGAEPFYRLGVSIEHAPVKRYIYPPKDFNKWARICEHIIRHYTEGWADGMRLNMRYWEIWNEPDGHGNMWLGTDEEFCEFYAVTALHLKKCFPDLKIGGPAFCAPMGSVRENFVRNMSERHVPLDFYSWHCYCADAKRIVSLANSAREILNSNGYYKTESVCDEWNFMENWLDQGPSYHLLTGNVGAAFCASVLCGMQQNTDIDHAEYFEADTVKEWCGLWEVDKMSIGGVKATVKPRKPYYAFLSFNKLYSMKNAVRAASSSEDIYVCAASDGSRVGLMAANYRGNGDENVCFRLSGIPEGGIEIRITDADRNDEVIAAFGGSGSIDFTIALPENSFVYIGSTDE